MMQVGRNLTDVVDGFLLGKRFLILDRDPLYTAAFRRLLADVGVEVVRLPARSPNLNAYAERFVRSVRDDCLNHIVPLGESRLRRVLREYLEHYHLERNHQGLDNQLIEPRAGPAKAPDRTCPMALTLQTRPEQHNRALVDFRSEPETPPEREAEPR